MGVRLDGCKSRCERRIEVIVKMQKENGGGLGVGAGGRGPVGGVRVDVNK